MKTLHEYKFALSWKNSTPLMYNSSKHAEESGTIAFILDVASIGIREWLQDNTTQPHVVIDRRKNVVWFTVLTDKSQYEFDPEPVMSAMGREMYHCSGFVREIGLILEPCIYVGYMLADCNHEYSSNGYIPVANTVYELFKCKHCGNSVKEEVGNKSNLTKDITPEKSCISM